MLGRCLGGAPQVRHRRRRRLGRPLPARDDDVKAGRGSPARDRACCLSGERRSADTGSPPEAGGWRRAQEAQSRSLPVRCDDVKPGIEAERVIGHGPYSRDSALRTPEVLRKPAEDSPWGCRHNLLVIDNAGCWPEQVQAWPLPARGDDAKTGH